MEEQKDRNLPIRLTEKQWDTLNKAAEKNGKAVSTWMREVCLVAAGEKRSLKDLLSANLANTPKAGRKP